MLVVFSGYVSYNVVAVMQCFPSRVRSIAQSYRFWRNPSPLSLLREWFFVSFMNGLRLTAQAPVAPLRAEFPQIPTDDVRASDVSARQAEARWELSRHHQTLTLL